MRVTNKNWDLNDVSTEKEVDIEKIIGDSSIELSKVAPCTYQYLISLGKKELKKRLTTKKGKEIAKNLVEKIKEDAPKC